MNTPASQKGLSLIELLIAMGIFTVGTVALGLLVIDASIASRHGTERTQATLLAREGIEAARSLRDGDFDNVTVGAHGIALASSKWIFSGASDTQNQFTRVVTVSDIDADTKKVVSTVTWQFTPARSSSVTLTQYLTDWNQTQGDAGLLRTDIASLTLGASNTEVQGVKLENLGTGAITISKVTAWWSGVNQIQEVKINTTAVWASGGPGTPSGAQSSGVELDIQDITLAASSGLLAVDRLLFSGSMSGTDFVIKFTMSDNSTKYLLLDF